MKIKEGYVLKEVAGSSIVVPLGHLDFNGVITLNETGVLLWKELESEKEEKDLVEAILKEYDVAPELAAADVHRFVEKMKSADLLA